MSDLESAVIDAIEFISAFEGDVPTGSGPDDFKPNRARRINDALRDAIEKDPGVLAARARLEAVFQRGVEDAKRRAA